MIFISLLCTFSGNIFNNSPLISLVGVIVWHKCNQKARKKKKKKKRDPAAVFLHIGESTFRKNPRKKMAMFPWSYYKNLLLLRWDWRAIIAFQLGLTPNKAHLNCPESNQGSLFSEKLGNFSCVQFGTGYCSDALFGRGKKGGWL